MKAKGAEMMKSYLDEDSETLDGFEFLTMAEAGEVGHWSILKTLNETAQHEEIGALVDWALPIQERHFAGVKTGVANTGQRGRPQRSGLTRRSVRSTKSNE